MGGGDNGCANGCQGNFQQISHIQQTEPAFTHAPHAHAAPSAGCNYYMYVSVCVCVCAECMCRGEETYHGSNTGNTADVIIVIAAPISVTDDVIHYDPSIIA